MVTMTMILMMVMMMMMMMMLVMMITMTVRVTMMTTGKFCPLLAKHIMCNKLGARCHVHTGRIRRSREKYFSRSLLLGNSFVYILEYRGIPFVNTLDPPERGAAEASKGPK